MCKIDKQTLTQELVFCSNCCAKSLHEFDDLVPKTRPNHIRYMFCGTVTSEPLAVPKVTKNALNRKGDFHSKILTHHSVYNIT